MINVNLKLFPIVLLDVASQAHRGLAYASPELMQAFENEGLAVLHYEEANDVLVLLKAKRDLGGIIVNLEYFPEETQEQDMSGFIERIRDINAEIPINVLTNTLHLNFLNADILKECECIIWRYDDTPASI